MIRLMDIEFTDEALANLIETVGHEIRNGGRVLAIAESCTGGWMAKLCTDLPGSSDWFERAFVCYSNASKQEMLGVGAAALARHGAVSEKVVSEMASGALDKSDANIAVAVSGVAGPDGGTPEKPVGTVCFAWADSNGGLTTETCHFNGDRDDIRRNAVGHGFRGIVEHLLRT